jgi:hypothetical protein
MQGLSFKTYCLKDHTPEAPFEQYEIPTSKTFPCSSSFLIWGNQGGLFLLAVPLFLSLYALFRAPTSDLGLAYYDDGETLYHAFAIEQGLVPYRDNYNHHFLGYVIPFLVTGWFSSDWLLSFALVRSATIVTSALLLFVLVRRWTTTISALLAGSLLISAREPWVLAFFQQYQLNFFIILGWILLDRFLASTRNSLLFLCLAGISYGCAFVFDQRALLLVSIPLFLVTYQKLTSISYPVHLLRELLVLCTSFCLPVVGCLLYLWSNGALLPWFQQTIYYPLFFRSAPLPISEKLKVWYALYAHLPVQSPFLFLTGLVGIVVLFFTTTLPPRLQAAKLLVACSLPALFLMPLMGGRDFDYYTITWLPALALTATLALQLFRNGAVTRKMHTILLSAALLVPIFESISNLPPRPHHYSGDGIEEVVSYLKATRTPSHSVYLWGYRLELYVRIGQVSALPFASRIFIHPDQQFPENREERVYPLYRDRFISLLTSSPPQYIIWFAQEKNRDLSSLAEDALSQILRQRYREVYTLAKRDFRGHWSSYQIYRRE